MAKTKISDFNSNPALNTDIDSINISEGCAPSGINDAIRELMAQLKDFQVGSAGDPVTVGGVLTVQAGAVGTPAITTAGDTNTGIFFPAADTIAFVEGGAEAARIDSSGNLGLGVTPSAWSLTSLAAFQIKNASLYGYSTDESGYSQNAYYNSGWKYISTGILASQYKQISGAHSWSTAASGTAGNAITFTQAMTLDASGNLGIGATSMSTTLELRKVGSDTKARFNDSVHYWDIGHLTSPNAFAFAYDGSEKARIDSSGNLLVGTTSTTPTSGGLVAQIASGQSYLSIGHVTGTSSGSYFLPFYYNGSIIGGVTQSGTTAVLYNVTSDQRLKENIQDSDSASSLIDSLKVRQFDWKSDNTHQRYGFVAQELVTVYPEAVHQPQDAEEMMAVDYSKLVPMLVKEVQSLRARVAQLESN